APGDVDLGVAARRARCSLARLRDRLVRDAACVHARDVPTARDLRVAVAEQTLAHGLRVRVRDLATEEPDGEGRHRRTSLVPLRENVCRPALELAPIHVSPA